MNITTKLPFIHHSAFCIRDGGHRLDMLCYVPKAMFYVQQQLYTPALEIHEFNRQALLLDTETVGSGHLTEIIEIALGDCAGHIIFQTLVQPVFNPLPRPSKHQRFERAEFAVAPDWPQVWPEIATLIDNKILVAYNAAFDRRALAATCARYRLPSPERGWRCAMQLVKKLTGAKRNPTLNDACAYFGVAGGNHRAARDVEATYDLLQKIKAGSGP
ncbi:MAG: 3'-5' exonuclease [Pyrinomonadaceae bacterium]|jgi:DNA polymerase III epsilon subunit-like protein|nr:3'-5' exonuclease [Pyrinomonadaceae bacterium]MDQ3585945.1 3'-5' exonuclease [Acidobacteriota bacterium]